METNQHRTKKPNIIYYMLCCMCEWPAPCSGCVWILNHKVLKKEKKEGTYWCVTGVCSSMAGGEGGGESGESAGIRRWWWWWGSSGVTRPLWEGVCVSLQINQLGQELRVRDKCTFPLSRRTALQPRLERTGRGPTHGTAASTGAFPGR